MISISAPSIDNDGNVIINETSGTEIDKREYRLAKAQTLDGGTIFTHSGYAVGDREISVSSKITASKAETLKHLGDTYTRHIIVTHEGVYLGAIKNISVHNGNLKMVIYLQQKES
jgi:hypothetical protein